MVTEPTTVAQFTIAEAWIAQAGAVIVVVMDPGLQWWIEDASSAQGLAGNASPPHPP